MFMSRILARSLKKGLNSMTVCNKQFKQNSTTAEQTSTKIIPASSENICKTPSLTDTVDGDVTLELRFRYQEFLPDPNVLYRNPLRERLERIDMLARRSMIGIPEFYVGSVLAVTYSEPHAPGKVNRFVGICIVKEGVGLRACFRLRNVVNNEPVEVLYDMYDPAIQKIDCLRLEKRLDSDLLYLRDAPLEYSTFPFDMEPQILSDGVSVPVNDIVVPLNPKPWLMKYEQKNYKGLSGVHVSRKRAQRAKLAAKPWEKWDLMKIYRETIPEEEQRSIFAEMQSSIHQIEMTRRMLKRRREFTRPTKKA